MIYTEDEVGLVSVGLYRAFDRLNNDILLKKTHIVV